MSVHFVHGILFSSLLSVCWAAMIESLIKVSYAELMCTNSNFVMLLINCEIFGVTVLMSVQYSTTKSHAYMFVN